MYLINNTKCDYKFKFKYLYVYMIEQNIKLSMDEIYSNKIFVSIACFMDNDILNTINDCLEKAEYPNNIVFGICFQHDPDDDYLKIYDNNPKFRIHRMHWNEAKGPTYARYFCSQLIKNEEFFLQIDCHTRFFDRWDSKIINELKKCEEKSDKSVISHYPINIKDMNNLEIQKKIGNITTFRYIGTDAIKSHGGLHTISNEPKQCWGIMAAMVFMRTKVFEEVPYDIKLYHGYHAEEQFFYAVRLWTHGYQCFSPSCHVLAMEYGTNRDRLPSETKSNLAKGGNYWNQKTWRKCKYYLKLDSLENVDCEEYKKDILENQKKYGLGNVRSVVDYYKMTNLHDKLCELFPFYKEYQKLIWHNKFNHIMELHNPSQKIAVVTQNTPNVINEYFKETRENHIMYCNFHNYTYYVFYENLAEEVNYDESPKICWSKVKACLNVIKNHDYIVWMDADSIFANQNIKIEDRIQEYPDKHFYLCKDPKSHFINSGVMIWKNSEVANSILQKWWDMEHIPYGKGGDQVPLGQFLKNNKEYQQLWHLFQERELNCYPSNYHPYDYIIHYMGIKSKINIKERVSNFNKLIKYENDKPKIYISIATIPSRINTIYLVIDSFLNNTLKPDKIILQIPEKYLLFPESYDHIEKAKHILKKYIDDNIIYINILQKDYGPCNKYQGIIQYCENNNLHNCNFLSIIADDDLLVYDFVIEEMYKKHKKNKRSVISGYSNPNNIKIKINNTNNILLLKGGNITLLPKYFFTTNINPSFKEIIENSIDSYKYSIFDDDKLITAFLYYKKIDIVKIIDVLNNYKKTLTYYYNNNINNLGLSHKENNFNIDKKHTQEILNNYEKYYNYEKYSNVDFKYN